MLGMMSNKGGQNSAVPGQQPQGGGMPDLAAMFRNNTVGPQGTPGQIAAPGQGVNVPWIAQPQRPVLAPPPRIPMPQPAAAAPAQRSAVDLFRDMAIGNQMNRRPQRGNK